MMISHHFSFLRFTVARRSSNGPTTRFILFIVGRMVLVGDAKDFSEGSHLCIRFSTGALEFGLHNW